MYCGIALHARRMDGGSLHQEGERRLHRTIPARPEPLLTALTPSRAAMVVAVACLFTWYGLADLGAPAGLAVVLGHARSRTASQGGKATNDTIDAPKSAGVLRGGRFPQVSVEPAARRALRALLRRRISLPRQRADRLAPIQPTNSPDKLPALGNKLADKAHRDGGAERCPAPAVPKSLDVDLALRGYAAPLLRALEWPIGQAAQQHDAPTLYRLQTVPGIGQSLRLVLL